MNNGCPSYHLTRRAFLKYGSLGIGTMLGMRVGDLVALAAEANQRAADHVILLWMGGGMSHIDTFDPKPGRPTQGEFEPIKTTVDGIELSEIMPNLAQQMKHCSLIRSVTGNSGDHGGATYNLMTGYRRAPQLIHPAMGSMVVHEKKPIGELPAFISISGRAHAAGYLGQACEAYFVARAGMPDPYVRLPEGITDIRAEKRLEALEALNKRFREKNPDMQIDAIDESYQAALNFMQSPALKAFELDEEPTETRERYGTGDFGRGCLLARRLVENGVRFVQVNKGGFDTHANNFNLMRGLGGEIDKGIAGLIGDLAASGMLDRTLVLVLSEFGRTPRINAGAGRDHWPRVFSSLIAGGGIKPGQVIGSSDEDGYEVAQRAVQVVDMHATVCAALGIDHTKHVQTPLGRPMKLVDGGNPIKELFS